MLGYTLDEVDRMIASIIIARRNCHDEIHDSLTQAIDLLNGLVVEGHIS